MFGKSEKTNVSVKAQEVAFSGQRLSWAEKLLNVPSAWKESQGEGVNVAILDSGIARHPDLIPNLRGGVNFTSPDRKDFVGRYPHGTHVASILGAVNNNFGVVGVAPKVNLWSVKVIGDDGFGEEKWLIDGLMWCVENNMDIVNMSLGLKSGSNALHKAIKACCEKNITMVAASGNDGESYQDIDYPANFPEVISVGSVNQELKKSKFSSDGKELDVVAPGEEIIGCYVSKDGSFGYANLTGTSMATPFVSGVVALLIGKHRKQKYCKTPVDTPERIREHLLRTATENGEIGKDKTYSYRIINPEKLLADENIYSIYANTKRLKPGLFAKVSAEERRKQTEDKKVRTWGELAADTTTPVLKNADAGAGGLSYLAFGLACSSLEAGNYAQAGGFFLAAVFVALFKHMLPQGPIVAFLKKVAGQIGTEKIIAKLENTLNRK